MSEADKGSDLTAGLLELRAAAAQADAADAEKNSPSSGTAGPGSATGPAEPEPEKAIDAAAAMLDAGATADAPDTWEDWREAINLALDWFGDSYPALATVYTERRKERLARAMHAVASKYGWTLAGLFLRFRQEITLLIVAGPIVRDTRKVLAAGRAVAEQPPAKPSAAPRDDVLRPNE